MTEEANLAVAQVDACGAFKQLYYCVAAVYFQYLAATDFTAGQLDFAQLVIGDALYIRNHHQRTCDLSYGAVFF